MHLWAQALDPLEQCNGPLFSICTDRDNAPRARGHRGQLFDALAQDARAGSAKGVAERDGATVGIDPVDRKATHIKVYTGFSVPIGRIGCSFYVRDQLRGERSVDLPCGYLFGPQPIPGKQSRNGTRGGHRHTVGAKIDRRHFPVDQLEHGSDTGPPQTFFVSNPDRCRAVSQRQGVSGSERARAATVKHGRELSQLLERRIRPGTPRGRRQGWRVIVARLVTTNPRPKEAQRAMAVMIHDALHAAIEAAAPSYWWQCCVLFETFDKADYLQTDSRG